MNWTWPAVVALLVVVAALVALFAFSTDVAMRQQILNYMDSVVAFIVGAAAGGAVGGSVAYYRGFATGRASR